MDNLSRLITLGVISYAISFVFRYFGSYFDRTAPKTETALLVGDVLMFEEKILVVSERFSPLI